MLQTSEAARQGAPLATVPAEGGYSVAPGLHNDLGIAVIVDLYSRTTGRRGTHRTLGTINLLVLALAGIAVIFAFPASLRLWLVPTFLLVPFITPLYRSADSVAIHGALAALATAIVTLTLRPGHAAMAVGAGAALFLVHKIRSPLALYGLGTLLAGAVVAWLATRDRGPVRRLLFLLLAFFLLDVPWRLAISQRSRDPRIIEGDTLPAHNVYNPLVSGIGWTENPWGIKPYDPWVAAYLAERVGGEPISLATRESEERARRVYIDLVLERPFALAWLYLRRVPFALARYGIFPSWGALAWLAVVIGGCVAAGKKRDASALALLTGALGITAGLVAQVALIDTRFIYAYPLGVTSALAAAAGGGVLIRGFRRRPADLTPSAVDDSLRPPQMRP